MGLQRPPSCSAQPWSCPRKGTGGHSSHFFLWEGQAPRGSTLCCRLQLPYWGKPLFLRGKQNTRDNSSRAVFYRGGACWRKSGRGICLAELSLDTLVSWHNVVASPDPFPGVLYECGFGTFTAWLLSAYSELVQQVGKCKDLVEQVWQSWQQRADMSRLPRDQSCRQSLAMGRSLQVRVCPGERGHGKGREHPAAAHGMLKGKRHLGNAPRCENKQMDEDSLGGWRLNLPTKSSGHFVKSYHLMLLVCGNESCWGSQGCLERLDTPKLYSHSVTLPVDQH